MNLKKVGVKMAGLIILCISPFVIAFSLPRWFRLHGRKTRISKEMFDASFWVTMICLLLDLIIVLSMTGMI